MLEELYQEIILDHYRRPRNKGRAAPADLQAKEYNPLCGDEIEVTATLRDGKLADVKFAGHGCSISQASASIMTQKLTGKTLAEAERLIDGFLKMMRGDLPFGGKEMGDLKALEGVLKFPVRVKCATLAWNTAAKGIAEKNPKSEIRNPKELENTK
ncbi:MAG TPA: SUF system NifU family Fe-S cluster assembly protein [Verrucomicrobiae bacterium]|nr:SUF system NifU family Fe-S cluster assembly protein [Verrucomicrobiae bacterium]